MAEDHAPSAARHTDTLWDAIIVGQGLAGTALAWCLHEAGQRVLMLDTDAPVTSSKIAAGLITPITGQRLLMSDTFSELLATAARFYQRCEQQTGTSFFHLRPAVRLFQSDTERQNWLARDKLALQPFLATPQPTPLLAEAFADTRCGGIAMHTAQLDTRSYLAASRALLPFQRMELDWTRDVKFAGDTVHVRGLRAHYVISCEGYAAAGNPHLSWLPFRAAKGDILTVRFAHPLPPTTVHRGIWIAPTAEAATFSVGSTYDVHNLDPTPSSKARTEIEGKLQTFVRMPYDVIEHQSAVRPILIDIKPAVGLHPKLPRLGYFNGLGSKGALQAPWFAQQFVQHLLGAGPLPHEACSRATSLAARAL
jgi:glycine oxidase